MFKVNNKNTFPPFSSGSICAFEQVNVSEGLCSCKPCNIFQNSFLTEQHMVTASERN